LRHRIHAPQPLRDEITIGGEEFHHAARVARVREGEEVELFDGRGAAVRAKVLSIDRDELRVRIESEIPSRELRVHLHLAMAIIQLDKFELVLQKATELGCRSILPLMTERVDVRPERYRGKAERWEKIVFEAVKQSGRSVIPSVETPRTFVEAIARDGLTVLFDADRSPGTLPESIQSITLFIGPEGGWSDEELVLAERSGCIFQRLGSRRLRAETAAIVATALLTARYGDI
jgi:16S rRNA (uracil1498-N3)-methyltransferase